MDLIWTVSHPSFTSTERCILQQTTQAWVVAGSVVASDEGRPLDVQYDDGWAWTLAITRMSTWPG